MAQPVQEKAIMSPRVHVDVVSAEELIFSGETDFAVFPGEAGELGIYPRHTPLLDPDQARDSTSENSGSRRVRTGSCLGRYSRSSANTDHFAGGYCNLCTRSRRSQITEAKRRAEEALKNRSADINYASAEAEPGAGGCAATNAQAVRKKH